MANNGGGSALDFLRANRMPIFIFALFAIAIGAFVLSGAGGPRDSIVRAQIAEPPGIPQLWINDGNETVDSLNVTLHMNVSDAEECRIKNDVEPDWGAWEAPFAQKNWQLSPGGGGNRIVAAQCRNAGIEGGYGIYQVDFQPKSGKKP
jgi:hypothetical protein